MNQFCILHSCHPERQSALSETVPKERRISVWEPSTLQTLARIILIHHFVVPLLLSWGRLNQRSEGSPCGNLLRLRLWQGSSSSASHSLSTFPYLGEGLTKGAKDLRVGAFCHSDFSKGKCLIKRTTNGRPYNTSPSATPPPLLQGEANSAFCILNSALCTLNSELCTLLGLLKHSRPARKDKPCSHYFE